jgi:hypothetical protein
LVSPVRLFTEVFTGSIWVIVASKLFIIRNYIFPSGTSNIFIINVPIILFRPACSSTIALLLWGDVPGVLKDMTKFCLGQKERYDTFPER